MADARDAAGPMNVEADVGLRREARLPGMETDADADFAALRPRLGGQRALRRPAAATAPGAVGKVTKKESPSVPTSTPSLAAKASRSSSW